MTLLILASLLAVAASSSRVLTGSWLPLVLPLRDEEEISPPPRLRDIGLSALTLFCAALLLTSGIDLPIDAPPRGGFIVMVLMAPLVETLLLQTLPAYCFRRLALRDLRSLLFVVFAGAHAILLPQGFVIGMVAGAWLACVYTNHLRQSAVVATLTSVGVHAGLNGLCWAAQFLL